MKKIIPAIDLYDGNAVRLFKGDFKRIDIYSKKPINLIKRFSNQGVDLIHVINLNGAKSGKFDNEHNFDVILSILEEGKKWGCKIQLGGGIRTEGIVKELLDLGLYKVIIGTIAIENPALLKSLLKNYQNDIIVALDIFNDKLRIKGWTQENKVDLEVQFMNLEHNGVKSFILTDVSRDGTLRGPNIEIYKKFSNLKQQETEIIASGGIRNIDDIKYALRYSNGVIIGKALYTNKIKNNDLKNLIITYDPTNLTKRIIPCLDVKNGRVVKGVKFNNLQDSGDPLELSKFYNSQGADELIFLDISATLENRVSMIEIIRKIAEEVYIPFTVGGGIRNLKDITNIIKAGAEKVSINTAAVKNPEIIHEASQKFGSQSIVVAIDVKEKLDSWEVFVKAGTEPTGLDAIQWAKEVVTRGAGELLVTSMDKDGTQTGYDLKLINTLSNAVPVPIIASGGAGIYDHFYQAINAGAEAVLAASLFHKKTISINSLKLFLLKHDIKVRL